ncbi:MAG: hypothetical protein HY751_05635 [Nitrospinae bacterium]|nr:hypothetical protein [Nitrospinota bacterium]
MNPVIKLYMSKGGGFSAGGASLEKIVAKAGTPLYLYDAGIMRGQYKALTSAIPASFRVHYSVKANPNRSVAHIFQKLGAGAEVASASELAMALSAGFKPEDIIYAGPGKSEEEIRLAAKKRIGSINIESETELERIFSAADAMGKKSAPVKIAFRVNLQFSAAGGTVMIGGARKFGFDGEKLLPVVARAIKDPRVDVLGFHCFAGTQLLDTATLGAIHGAFGAWAVEAAAKLSFPVRMINFGGGLGIPFKEGERELDVKKLGAALKKTVNRLGRSAYFKNTRYILEPGRYLAGPAGVYVTRITDIKESRGRTFVLTDGGIHHALVPIVFNKNYPSALLNRMGEPARCVVTVAGPLCASADQFSRELKLPKPRVGDLLGVFNSGAYGYTAGMIYFLSHPAPAEALVDGGKAYIIRKRELPDHGLVTPVEI